MSLFYRLFIAGFISLVSAPCFAISYNEILDLSGIKQQVQSLPELIQQSAMDSDCSGKKEIIQDITTLKGLFENTTPAKLFEKQLPKEHLGAIENWLKSDTGIAFQEADKNQELNDAEFEKALVQLKEHKLWKSTRQALIKKLINDTQLHRYVATLNYGIDQQGRQLAGCSEKTSDPLSTAQSDIEFNSFFIMQYLLEPVAVSYRELSEEMLLEMIDFANTTAGIAYHRALIQTMSDGLGIKQE